MQEINKADSYKPTLAMIANAKRGLALREKWGRGGLNTREAGEQGIGSGVARARDIVSGNVSLETVKRMNSFFARHAKNYKPGKKEADGGPTAGTIAFLLWSGSAGAAWARSILRKEEQAKKSNLSNQLVVKALDEEKRIATFVVLEPQYEDDMTSDLHSDWYDEDDVFKAMMNFNRYCRKASLFHAVETSDVEFLESFVTKTDMELGGRYIRKGTWIATVYCPPDNAISDYVWKGIKDGTFTGLSIQCMATTEPISDE